MPIYEYRCRSCGKTSSFLTLSVSAALEPKCRHCGGLEMEKLVSRVAVLASGESRLRRAAGPDALDGADESDPKSLARFMKTMGREMGGDPGDDFDREVEEAAEEAAGAAGDDFGPGPAGDPSDEGGAPPED